MFFPSSSLWSEPMQNIMEISGFLQTLVNVDVNDLPEHLDKAYNEVLPVDLWENYNGISCALCRQFPCHKHQLYYIYNNPPPGRVRVFLFLRRRKPDLQVLHPHSLWDLCLIWMNASHGTFNFLLIQDSVRHINRI